MAEGSRTAFQLFPALTHKGRESVISAVAVDDEGEHLYLGTSDGQLEEHRLQCSMQGARVSLGARKHVGKKPVTAVVHIAGAQKLAVLCDGGLLLLDYESLEEAPLPGIRGATAIALQPPDPGVRRPRLAVAQRVSKRSVRVAVLEVLPGTGLGTQLHAPPAVTLSQADLPEPLLVKAMAWLGASIVVVTGLRYMLFAPGGGNAYQELFAVSAEAPPPTMVQAIPSAHLALLLMDQVGIVVNEAGAPAQSALTFPSGPSALAASGIHVLAACADGVHVYDRTSGAWVQSLPWPGGLRTAPGQQLCAAANPRGSVVLVAGFRRVWLYRPVALEEQARELLRGRNFEAALALAEVCAADGAPWAETASAQAALLLMQDLRFREAMDALLRCSTATVQPALLFPLFPDVMRPWLAQTAKPAAAAEHNGRRRESPGDQQQQEQYWGLHEPLPDLRALVARVAAAEKLQHGLESNGDSDGIERRVALAAQKCIADYLAEVRHWDGVQQLDGVDTLLAHLLADAGQVAALEAFAAAPNQARLDVLAGGLRAAARHHVLALLSANAGDAAGALALWKGIAEGTLEEAPAPEGEAVVTAAEGGPAEVAVHRATALLLDGTRVEPELALAYVPWLLGASPEAGLAVLKGRDLDPEEVLPLLRERSAALSAQYLEHLITHRGSRDAQHHTELALTLSRSILARMPPFDASAPAWERALAAAQRSKDAGDDEESELRGARHKLCSLLEESQLYDARLVLREVGGSELWDEQVLLHCRLGEHARALRLLALVLCDIRLAEAYCARYAGAKGHALLLDMLLRPGDGREPLYVDACHLLAAQGAGLDATRVLDALPEDMPLSLAADIAGRMLRTAVHARRSAAITRNLWRALHLSAAAQRAELMQRRVVSTEERACRLCHTRTGNKMFAVYPNGVLVCFKCYKKHDPSVCPLTGRDFREPEQPRGGSGGGGAPSVL